MVDRPGHSRRQILKAAIGGTAGLVLGAPQCLTAASAQASSEGAGIQPLGDNLFVVRIPGESNVVAHTSAGGALLVDGGSARASEALMKTIAGLPGGGPVHTIFNTHWHPEQTGSNEPLGKAGRTIIATKTHGCGWRPTSPGRGTASAQTPAEDRAAEQDFYTTGTLDSGVRYGYIPDAAHTDGDLYVHFPTQNVLAVGDVVSGQGWPVVDYVTGGWIGGIVGGLQRLQTLVNEETRIVPGRGPVLGLNDLKAQYEMYATIYDRLTQLLNKGRGPGEAVAAQPTKEFDAQMGNPDEFVRRAFESLWAYVSPDA